MSQGLVDQVVDLQVVTQLVDQVVQVIQLLFLQVTLSNGPPQGNPRWYRRSYHQQMLDQVVEVEHLLQAKCSAFTCRPRRNGGDGSLTPFLVHCLQAPTYGTPGANPGRYLRVVVLVEVVFPLLLELMDLVERWWSWTWRYGWNN